MARKQFTTSLDEDLLKRTKKLAIDLNCDTNDLIEQGMAYILDNVKLPESPSEPSQTYFRAVDDNLWDKIKKLGK